MSDEVERHYAALLARHYSRMAGMPFEDKVAEQRALLSGLGVAPGNHGLAIDLGSGPGFQAFALAELGFSRVLAIDTSDLLLEELRSRKSEQPIETIRADLTELPRLVERGSAAAIVCMGDTLTHLEHRRAVSRLFADAHAALAPGGILVLTFRDLSQELIGLDRIVPVHADADRIMGCFLEYEAETVVVNDIIYTREGESWRLAKGSYRKLRLAPHDLAGELQEIGFAVLRDEPAGRLHAILARR